MRELPLECRPCDLPTALRMEEEARFPRLANGISFRKSPFAFAGDRFSATVFPSVGVRNDCIDKSLE